jgi:hypothetical protein
MAYSVYIIYSEQALRFYVGISENVERTEALVLEKKIKKRGIKRYLQDNNLA